MSANQYKVYIFQKDKKVAQAMASLFSLIDPSPQVLGSVQDIEDVNLSKPESVNVFVLSFPFCEQLQHVYQKAMSQTGRCFFFITPSLEHYLTASVTFRLSDTFMITPIAGGTRGILEKLKLCSYLKQRFESLSTHKGYFSLNIDNILPANERVPRYSLSREGQLIRMCDTSKKRKEKNPQYYVKEDDFCDAIDTLLQQAS